MNIESGKLVLNDEDLKEIFSLFSSPTTYERNEIYQKDSNHYFEKVNLSDEYELTEEKKDFALDAWRAVTFFLHSKGYAIIKDGKIFDLSRSEEDFL
ncbi:MAG: hypothetical protein KIT57_24570 [Blastocatellales bacterium]|nr:hypothetical protein [Blastocatellales bacterium]